MGRTDERIPAVIHGRRSEASNCVCDMCHGIGFVAKITYTCARYRKESNFKKLGTKEKVLWLFDECRTRLMDVLRGCAK